MSEQRATHKSTYGIGSAFVDSAFEDSAFVDSAFVDSRCHIVCP